MSVLEQRSYQKFGDTDCNTTKPKLNMASAVNFLQLKFHFHKEKNFLKSECYFCRLLWLLWWYVSCCAEFFEEFCLPQDWALLFQKILLVSLAGSPSQTAKNLGWVKMHNFSPQLYVKCSCCIGRSNILMERRKEIWFQKVKVFSGAKSLAGHGGIFTSHQWLSNEET